MSHQISFQISLTVLIVLSLCSFFNASMDTIDHHWEQSIFNKYTSGSLNDWLSGVDPLPRYWYVHPIFYDGWHMFKNMMVFCFIVLISYLITLSTAIFHYRVTPQATFLLWVIGLNLVWFLIFKLFYEVILL